MQLNRRDEFAALLGQAVEHHLQGHLAEAMALYDAAIGLNPNVAADNGSPGLAKQPSAVTGDARLHSDYAVAHYNKAIALKQLQRLEEAVESYDRAIALDPEYVEAHCNRGNTLREL